MKVRERRESGKRATGHVCARPKPPNNTARETSPANDVDPIEELVARFNERSAGVLRELLSEMRLTQRRAPGVRGRHVALPEDLEPVDELTRARARKLLARHDPRRGARR